MASPLVGVKEELQAVIAAFELQATFTELVSAYDKATGTNPQAGALTHLEYISPFKIENEYSDNDILVKRSGSTIVSPTGNWIPKKGWFVTINALEWRIITVEEMPDAVAYKVGVESGGS